MSPMRTCFWDDIDRRRDHPARQVTPGPGTLLSTPPDPAKPRVAASEPHLGVVLAHPREVIVGHQACRHNRLGITGAAQNVVNITPGLHIRRIIRQVALLVAAPVRADGPRRGAVQPVKPRAVEPEDLALGEMIERRVFPLFLRCRRSPLFLSPSTGIAPSATSSAIMP